MRYEHAKKTTVGVFLVLALHGRRKGKGRGERGRGGLFIIISLYGIVPHMGLRWELCRIMHIMIYSFGMNTINAI